MINIITYQTVSASHAQGVFTKLTQDMIQQQRSILPACMPS